MSPAVDDTMTEDPLVNAEWVIHSTYNTTFKSTPRAAIFGRDVLFNIPYAAHWNQIGRSRQRKVKMDR